MHAKGFRERNETDHGLQREREKNGSLKSVFDYIYLYLLFVCLKKKEEEERIII